MKNRNVFVPLFLVLLIPPIVVVIITNGASRNISPKYPLLYPLPERGEEVLHFYNDGETPPSLPVMIIYFTGFPMKEHDRLTALWSRMQDKIFASGNVQEESDYKRLDPVLVEHVKEMIAFNPTSIMVEFPRKQHGISLYQKK